MKKVRVVAVLLTLIGITSCGSTEDPAENGISTIAEDVPTSINFSDRSLVEVRPLEFRGGTSSLQVPLVKTDGTHLLIISSVDLSPTNYYLQLADSSLPALTLGEKGVPQLDEEEEPADAQFHQFLQEAAVSWAESPESHPVTHSPQSALSEKAKKGDSKTFKVLSTMSSLSQYEKVSATLRASTNDLLFYVDDEVADQVSDKALQELASKFQDEILPQNRARFGTESDVNGDGQITILMSCVTNGMSSSGGIVTGFFFPGDCYKSSSSNPASNEQEIFYTLVPDPEGRCGVPISEQFAFENILPGVLAHEHQHMISFNRNVFQGSGQAEEPWLNEALSHLAEDLVGYGNENSSRLKLFLDRPNTTSLIPASSPTLAERGAGYSFLRFIYEQHSEPSKFLEKLLNGGKTGAENIRDAVSGYDSEFDEIPELIHRWSIALALTGTGVTDDPKLTYKPRVKDETTGNWTGVCLRCDAGDGRGTILSGPVMLNVTQFPVTTNVRSTSTQFFLIENAPADLSLQASGSPTLTGSVLRLE